MQRIKIKYFEYGKTETDYLISVDEKLGNAIKSMGKVEREVIPDLFAALIYAIVGQQISVKAVHTIWDRMQRHFGVITPRGIASSQVSEIQQQGLSTRKASYIKSAGEAVMEGLVNLEELKELSD